MQAKGFATALAAAQGIVAAEAAKTFHQRNDPLNAAMAYALEGGKALRGFFVIEGARLHGVDSVVAGRTALAIECMHAYSLIHDDLPCMDDDDLRRGKPTVHKAWDECTAVLAGDALHTLTFELLSRVDVAPSIAVDLLCSMAVSAGRDGMVGGQMLDIQAETSTAQLTLDRILEVQSGKTGALIRWSCAAGARLGGADPAPLETYGDKLGLAFQIADDILDVEGDAAKVGKAVRKDAEAGKATFVSLLGRDGAKRRAEELVTEACSSLDPYGKDADCLREAARFVITRQS